MELSEAKTRLQQHLSDGLVVIIGSGMSCAEGLPGMGELAQHLKRTINPGTTIEDITAWTRITMLLESQGLEAAMLVHAPTPGLEEKIASATASLIVERERAIISEVFNGTRKLRLTRLVDHLLKPSAGIPILTTNYDRLVEIAVEEAGIGADTMFFGRFAGVLNERESKLSFCRDVKVKKDRGNLHYKQRARIFKPHGSLDWYFREGKPVCYGGDLPGLARLIITPGHNKFRNGYESPFDHHRSRANTAIDEAMRFLILGYGFNDDHLETHLSPAIGTGKPTLMITRELSTKALQIAYAHANVIAIDQYHQSGIAGTRIIIDKSTHSFPGQKLWDVNDFVTGVLQ